MGLTPILSVLLRILVHDWYSVEFTAWASLLYFQHYSVYWFTTGTTWSLLHGPHSHTSSTTPSTGSRLILRRVYCMGLAPILSVLLSLLVHDWYYIEFTAWASLLYFQHYSVYWFTTGTTWSFLHGPHSHTSSTTPSTGSRLILRRVYCMGLAPILPVLLHLLVHDWYYVEFTAWASLPYF
jgi:hypothetical protein